MAAMVPLLSVREVGVPMQAPYRSQSAGPATPGPRPSVVPTRRRLDRRFPSLGFTVAAVAPWAEVLLATDPSLFDASRSSSRTQATFYASRTTGGLTPLISGRARYVVPPAVVDRLAQSGTSIWYLAVAYPDATGVGGVASAASGASGAVAIDASYRRGSTAAALTVTRLTRALSLDASLDRLEGEDGADLQTTALVSSGLSRWRRASLSVDAASDRLEGEDGADLPRAPAPMMVSGPVRQGPDAPVPSNGTGPAAPPVPNGAPVAVAQLAPNGPPVTLNPADYDDDWEDRAAGTVPALGAPATPDDEYLELDWGGPGDGVDDYGEVPPYRGLEEPTTGDPSAPSGPATQPGTRPAAIVLPTLDLTPEAQRRIIELTAGGDGAAYSAIDADGPFRGRFGPGHKAYQRFHTGLSYGIAGFNQDAGTLGQLLRLMQQRSPDSFASVFGPAAAELLEVTTAPGPSGEHVDGGHGPRVQPVDGAEVWEEPWVARLRAAGSIPAFRAAQNQLTAELYLAPMLTVAAGFGLVSERALCMVLDRAIALGEQGAKRWLADTVGPAQTHARRHDALAALGFDSIEAFQAAVPGLLNDGEFGPVTHATLTAALRDLGPASPLPLPTIQQMVEAMADRGEGESGTTRLVRLATAPEFGDEPLGG
jgi:hypothetical protein